MGVRRTLTNIRAWFYWVKMKEDVMEQCRKCVSCAKRKHPTRKRKVPVKKYQVGLSLNQLMLGQEITSPLDIMPKQRPYDQGADEQEYATELQEHLEHTYTQARANLGQAAAHQKQYYGVTMSGTRSKPGDTGWILAKDSRKGVCPKLLMMWKGPALVEMCFNDMTHRLCVTQEQQKVIHFDILKPYVSDSVPDWMLIAK